MPKRNPSRPNPEMTDAETPELDDAFFASARPAAEIMDAQFIADARRAPGRPRVEQPKAAVSLRLDAQVVAHLRAEGPGWQTRVNAALTRLIAAGEL